MEGCERGTDWEFRTKARSRPGWPSPLDRAFSGRCPNPPNGGSGHLVLDPSPRQEVDEFTQQMRAHEDDRLTKIANTCLLDESGVAVLSTVGSGRVAVHESLEAVGHCPIGAVHVPCHDEPGFSSIGLALAHPFDRRSPDHNPRLSSDRCPKSACVHLPSCGRDDRK